MNMVSKEKLKSYFSKIPKTLVIFILILFCSTLTILKMRKTIIVTIDDKDTQITTLSSKLDKILGDNNIVLGEKDSISVDVNSKIKDGDKINIKRAIPMNISVDGKQLKVKTVQNTVNDVIKEYDIKLGKLDKISPDLKTNIKHGLNVNITRVKEKLIEKKEPIQFAKEIKKTKEYETGTEKVIQNGELGEKLISTKVVYENGKEVSRKVVNEKVTKHPINKVVAIGTLNVLRPSRGSKNIGNLNYSRKLSVEATAYTSDFNSLGNRDDSYAGMTASGKWAKRNPAGYSTIAVDPRVIPLGTKVYVEGYGLAIAEDTGGAIKGNIIDLYMNSHSEAVQWGRRNVNIYILE